MAKKHVDEASGIVFREAEMLDLDRIHPNDWNPNEQSEFTYNELTKEIEEEGFDQPIGVVPCTCDLIPGEHYVIIKGEHRWTVCKSKGAKQIPAVIYEDWDEAKQMIKTVRDNLLRGKTNPQKFTELTNRMAGLVDSHLLPSLMGFESDDEMSKFLLKDRDKRDKSFVDGIMDETKKETYAVDSLTDIVGTIFAKARETVDQNYLMFAHKGKNISVILCDGPMFEAVKRMTTHLEATGEKATDFLTAAIEQKLE